MEPFNFRIATKEDIPSLMQIINKAYRGDAARQGWTHEADLIDGMIRTDASALEDIMKSPGAVMLKCIGEDQLVGCVYLHKQGAQLYLGMLTVDPAIQGKGIGKQLLQAAEDHARKQNCNSIIMTVISVRKELIEWYERNGYVSTGESKPFPDDEKFGKPKKQLEFVVLKKEV
jgi:ribosomal protein S18 acetylase RimI-like enzyme